MITDCNDTSGFEELIRRMTVKDASGNKYLRIGTETPPFANAQYLSYDHVSGNQSVDFTEWEFFNTSDYSISFWFRHFERALTASIMHQQPHNPQWFIYCDAADFKLKFFGALGLTFPAAESDNALAGSTWYHCVLVHDRDGDIRWYIDTTPQTVGTSSAGMMDDNRNTLQWGGYSGGDYCPHDVDEICFFAGTLLQPADIATLYGGGTPQTAGDPTTVTGLTHYWKIDNDTAPAITDRVGAVHGAMQNMIQANIVDY